MNGEEDSGSNRPPGKTAKNISLSTDLKSMLCLNISEQEPSTCQRSIFFESGGCEKYWKMYVLGNVTVLIVHPAQATQLIVSGVRGASISRF